MRGPHPSAACLITAAAAAAAAFAVVDRRLPGRSGHNPRPSSRRRHSCRGLRATPTDRPAWSAAALPAAAEPNRLSLRQPAEFSGHRAAQLAGRGGHLEPGSAARARRARPSPNGGLQQDHWWLRELQRCTDGPQDGQFAAGSNELSHPMRLYVCPCMIRVHPGFLKPKPLKFRDLKTPVFSSRSCHAMFCKYWVAFS